MENMESTPSNTGIISAVIVAGAIILALIGYFVYTLYFASDYEQIEADIIEEEPLASMTVGQSSDMTCQKSKVQYVVDSDDKYITPSNSHALCYGIKVKYVYNNIEYKPYVIPSPGNTILLSKLHESDTSTNKYLVEAAKNILIKAKPILKPNNKIDIWINKTSPEICFSYNPDIVNIDTEPRIQYVPYNLVKESVVLKVNPYKLYKVGIADNETTTYDEVNIPGNIPRGVYFPHVSSTITVDGKTYTDRLIIPAKNQMWYTSTDLTPTVQEAAAIELEKTTAAAVEAARPNMGTDATTYNNAVAAYSAATAALRLITSAQTQTPYIRFYNKMNMVSVEITSNANIYHQLYYNVLNPEILYTYDLYDISQNTKSANIVNMF